MSQPKFHAINSVKRVALPDITQSNSGTVTIATPAPNASHSRQRSILKKNKLAVTINKTARL